MLHHNFAVIKIVNVFNNNKHLLSQYICCNKNYLAYSNNFDFCTEKNTTHFRTFANTDCLS